MHMSEKIDQIAAALVNAQKVIKPALKDTTNPFFNKKYADLSSVWEAVRGPLNDNGIAVVQGSRDGMLCTVLMHTSGQWVMSDHPIVPVKNDPQSVGSAITYARRYMLMAMTGVPVEDDDGNAASTPAPNPVAARAAGPNLGGVGLKIGGGGIGLSGGAVYAPHDPNVVLINGQNTAVNPSPLAVRQPTPDDIAAAKPKPAKSAGSWAVKFTGNWTSWSKAFTDKVSKCPDLKSYEKLYNDNSELLLKLCDENTQQYDTVIAACNARKDELMKKEA